MNGNESPEPPETTKVELIASVLKGLLGMVPVVGSPLAETLGFVGQRVVNKRLQEFFDAVASGLGELQVQFDNLSDSFWTTCLHAAEVVRRTHQMEKREALKNAVINSAKPSAPEDNLQHIFVNLIDEFTPLHLRLLGLFVHPNRFGIEEDDFHKLHSLNPNNPRAAWEVIDRSVAPSTRRDITHLCLKDLVDEGLLEYRQDPGPLQWATLPWLTGIGLDFYLFITSEEQQTNVGN